MPPRYAEIRDDLRRPIVTGKFPPGESLPDRHTLMDQYDATVNAVRRALHDLAAEGLVVIGLHAVVAEPQFSDNRSCGDRVARPHRKQLVSRCAPLALAANPSRLVGPTVFDHRESDRRPMERQRSLLGRICSISSRSHSLSTATPALTQADQATSVLGANWSAQVPSSPTSTMRAPRRPTYSMTAFAPPWSPAKDVSPSTRSPGTGESRGMAASKPSAMSAPVAGTSGLGTASNGCAGAGLVVGAIVSGALDWGYDRLPRERAGQR